MSRTRLDHADVLCVRHWPPAMATDGPVAVSVLVPCFRVEPTIEGALQGIENQRNLLDDFAMQAVLVVDGVVSDAAHIRALLDARPRPFRFAVTLIELRRNLGAGLARCYGWEYCSGELVALLDDDDVWHPDKLAIQWALHQRHPNQIVSGHLYGPTPSDLAEELAPSAEHEGKPVQLRHLLLRSRFATPTLMIRHSLWPEGPERFRLGEDSLMKYMMASQQPIMELPLALACRSPAALPVHADAYSLSRQKHRARLSQMRNYCLLVWRGRLSAWLLPPLLLWSLALWHRRCLLDLTTWARRQRPVVDTRARLAARQDSSFRRQNPYGACTRPGIHAD